MTAHTYSPQADADAEQAAALTQWAKEHPDALRPTDWRNLAWRFVYLAVLAVGLVFLLSGLVIGLLEPGPWAALAVVGAVLLAALIGTGRGC